MRQGLSTGTGRIFGLVLTVLLVMSFVGVSCSQPAPTSAPVAQPAPAKAPAPTASPAAAAPSDPSKLTKAQWQAWYDDEMNKLAAKARTQGPIIIYAPISTPEFLEAIRKYFSTKWGVEPQYVMLSGNELMAKIKAEAAANKVVAAAHLTGSILNRQAALAGLYERYEPPAALEPGVKWVVDPLQDKDMKGLDGKGYAFSAYPSTDGWLYNTQIVPPAKVPKNYDDLLDPFWKGKIGWYDPRISGGGNAAYTLALKIYGDAFMRKLKEQNITLGQNYTVGVRSVATGELALWVSARTGHLAGYESAPIKLMMAKNLAVGTSQMGLLKGSPNLDGGKLWINFMLSKDGQEILAKSEGRTPVRADVAAADPLDDLGLLMNDHTIYYFTLEDDMTNKAAAQKHAQELFGK
ncbi:MAG: extracellular solute-binding protein [Chloroflexi bacterium]|nr:extracellular solute-binding protein [Chloroflexota bacterium]